MKTLIIFLSLLSLQAMAAEETNTTYRYPSDLSDEEHAQMFKSKDKYDQCLKKEAMENIDKYDDFRKVADVAMKNCQATLTEIDNDLTKMNLDPDFKRFFLHKTSQKSAQQLLPELMMMKAK